MPPPVISVPGGESKEGEEWRGKRKGEKEKEGEKEREGERNGGVDREGRGGRIKDRLHVQKALEVKSLSSAYLLCLFRNLYKCKFSTHISPAPDHR